MEQVGLVMPKELALKLEPFLEAAEELMRFDETARALQLLDNLPAYYRDHIPSEVLNLKNRILKKVCTPRDYSYGEARTGIDDTNRFDMHNSLRGQKIVADIRSMDCPNVVDYGPGDMWLGGIIKSLELDCTYIPRPLNTAYYERAMTHFPFMGKLNPEKKTIFVACEIIEHLWQEDEIKMEALKCGVMPDVIHVSTPLYTFNAEHHWDTKEDIGHLRAYTPKEFADKIYYMFPEYDAEMSLGLIMHLRLTKKA